MANKIKVKMVVVLDDSKEFSSEEEAKFDGDMSGSDLAEAVIYVVSQIASDLVKESIR